jgi:hypothetical protein
MNLGQSRKILNWNAGLGMMASLLGSFALYGAAMGAYITLMNYWKQENACTARGISRQTKRLRFRPELFFDMRF